MGYKNVSEILPENLVRQIQEFIDGDVIYIPRKAVNRKCWGDGTDTKKQLQSRDMEIVLKYSQGVRVSDLANEYHMSTQGIYKILSKKKNL